jgi:hypothetical protein
VADVMVKQSLFFQERSFVESSGGELRHDGCMVLGFKHWNLTLASLQT